MTPPFRVYVIAAGADPGFPKGVLKFTVEIGQEKS